MYFESYCFFFCFLLFNLSIHSLSTSRDEINFIEGDGAPDFANYIQDHMVLQRAPQHAVVWRFGDASALTTLRMNDKIYTTISSSERVNELGESNGWPRLNGPLSICIFFIYNSV